MPFASQKAANFYNCSIGKRICIPSTVWNKRKKKIEQNELSNNQMVFLFCKRNYRMKKMHIQWKIVSKCWFIHFKWTRSNVMFFIDWQNIAFWNEMKLNETYTSVIGAYAFENVSLFRKQRLTKVPAHRTVIIIKAIIWQHYNHIHLQ